MTRQFQFSLRSFLLFMAVIAVSLAAIMQVPHVFLFAVCCLFAGVSFLLVYWSSKRKRGWLLSLPAAAVACFAFYVLSLGPFIALSEAERKFTGQHHLGRMAVVYFPIVVRLNHKDSFRWYMSQWIPPDAEGLYSLSANRVLPALLGTWKGEWGQLMNFRSNGTGRADLKDSRIVYFEWTCDANEFAEYSWGEKRSAHAWFGREMMNQVWVNKLDVVEMSATQFKLQHKSGRVVSFTRTQAKELESLP